jgi:beta-mannosidase
MAAAPPILRWTAGLLICLLAWGHAHAQNWPPSISVDAGWQFRKAGQGAWQPAQVPGTVQTDLYAAGQIEDPYYRMNAHDLAWVEQSDWEYRCALRVDAAAQQASRQFLHFDGLDTYCEVELNGRRILKADNMFRAWAVDVSGQLNGRNDSLYIRFFAPGPKAAALAAQRPYRLPADSDQGDPARSVYTRKAGYQFGWDFAPRIVTMGIWRPVRLACWNDVHVADPFTRVTTLSATAQTARMDAELGIEVARLGTYDLVLEVDGRVVAERHESLPAQLHVLHIPFEIRDPQLWWPAGSGAPHLYDFTLRIRQDGRDLARHQQKFGVRTVRLVQAADSIGRSFYFEVNGRPIFIKGSNYVPSDLFLPRARYNMGAIYKAMAATHMNMVRVWGGGAYPDDAFYDACDSLGILVWQDFMFAGGMYPADPAFQANVRNEVIGEVLRLRRHASLALWCGNNEMDVAWHNWGWQAKYGLHGADSAEVWDNYLRIFKGDIPELLAQYQPEANYLPSSPISNWGKVEFLRSGNQHDWEVWHGGAPIEVLGTRAARFVTEYGFQSYPAFSTLEPYSQASDRNMDSDWMRDRQKSYKGNAPILAEVTRQFGTPRDYNAFLTLSQLVQAQALTYAIEAQRTSRPHCMGTLYWQLNDCWPGPSWSTVDYLGRWKAGHYALQRLYAPLLLTAQVEGGDVVAHIAYDQMVSREATLRLTMKSFTGNIIGQHEAAVVLRPESAWEAFRLPTKVFAGRFDPATTLLEASIHAGGKVLASDVHYFVPAAQQRLPDPDFKFEVVAADDHYLLTIAPRHLMRCVELRVQGAEAEFSDNFFDFLPGASYTVALRNVDARDANDIRDRLRFRDLGRLVK